MCYCILYCSLPSARTPACSQLPAPSFPHPCTSGLAHAPRSLSSRPPFAPLAQPAAAFPPAPLAQRPLKAKSLGSANRCRLEERCISGRTHTQRERAVHRDLCIFWNSGLGPIPDQSDQIRRLTRAGCSCSASWSGHTSSQPLSRSCPGFPYCVPQPKPPVRHGLPAKHTSKRPPPSHASSSTPGPPFVSVSRLTQPSSTGTGLALALCCTWTARD